MYCLVSARVVQNYVLDEIDDPRLAVYTVWGPMQGYETEEAARDAVHFLPGERVSHFWTPANTLVETWSPRLGLVDELAWDTFLVYGPGTRWDEAPPAPAAVMHVDKRSLPEADRLNGEDLRERIRRQLAALDCPESGP